MTTVVNKYTHTPTPDDVYIGRGSKWGNPFRIGEHGTREGVVQRYACMIVENDELLAQVHELKGKNLICYCAPKLCHGDVLKEIADSI